MADLPLLRGGKEPGKAVLNTGAFSSVNGQLFIDRSLRSLLKKNDP
jgi:hypothetical protein